MIYNEAQLVYFAESTPRELVKILSSPNANPKLLAEGIEILAERAKDETIVLPILTKLLSHGHMQAREGSLVAVAAFYTNKTPPEGILARLKAIAAHDPSPELKSYAKEILEGFI